MAVMIMRKLTDCKAYQFCEQSIKLKTTPKYVKLQMADFMRICEGKDEKYMVSGRKLKQLENILKILIMPKGLKAGQSLYDCTVGYQWLLYTAILCTVHRADPTKRRYETGVLEISRKNFKTFSVATLFIILLLTEPPESEMFSVAPDGALSKLVKDALGQILRASPMVYRQGENYRFKILRDYILFKPNRSQITPLSYSTSRLDGRVVQVYLADEIGALPSNYAIEAMKSGQTTSRNKLGFLASTKYPTVDNPLEEEVMFSKRVLEGTEKDETRFSLLYEPDETKGWETNDLILQQANPAALEIPEIWDDLVQKRAQAIVIEGKRENFITKHCNIIYQGAETETYIDVRDVQACRVSDGVIDWKGRVAYLGLDLSQSGDNTSVSMLALDDDNNILAKSWAFIPEGRIDEKTITEKVNYRELIKTGSVIASGDRTIDYAQVEDFILKLEKKYGVKIQAIGADPWNAASTSQKLENEGYAVVMVKQHSSIMSAPEKLLKEKIINGEFMYEKNTLYEINFQNARCMYDTNLNLYVAKKKSQGKVDMVVSTAIATYLLQQDALLDQAGGFTAQVL